MTIRSSLPMACMALCFALAFAPLAQAQGRYFEEDVYLALKERHVMPDLTFDKATGRLNSGALSISLDNVKKEAQRRQLEGQAAVDFAVKTIEGGLRDQATAGDTKTWADVKQRIYPTISPIVYLQAAHCTALSRQTARCFVIDMPNSRAFVMPKEMQAWGISQSELESTALDNLRKITPLNQLGLHKVDGRLSIIYAQTGDTYDPSRILLPEVQKFIRMSFMGNAVVGLPNRGLMMAWRPEMSKKLNLDMQVMAQFKTQPNPLTPELFYLDENGLHLANDAEVFGDPLL
ncbi:MAG TPA: DUF1444 family protein, partial [Aquabacterium sp.]|uniref:DUF1444 family protein n=1 Tax=Aquabacterium sp. TaxID=1872578 RepID=UPI002E346AAC